MKTRAIGICLVLLALQVTAFCGQVAVLRNGFSIQFDRSEQSGDKTRLYVRGGFVDIATAEIASIEPDDTPSAAPASPISPTPVPTAAASTSSSVPISSIQSSSAQRQAQVAPMAVTTAERIDLGHVDLDQVIREASSRHRLDPDFVNSVIKAESNFQSRAVSRKGAQGLMQLMPQTASKLGVANAFDPKANVEGGTTYLSELLDRYHDDPIKALAAYNAGAHRVEQYHGVPPYRETQAYVARIVRDFNAKKRAQMKAQTAGTKTATKKSNATPTHKGAQKVATASANAGR